jgi:hypothetical protein
MTEPESDAGMTCNHGPRRGDTSGKPVDKDANGLSSVSGMSGLGDCWSKWGCRHGGSRGE